MAKKVSKSSPVKKSKKARNPFVIVRSHTAGVHAGHLESRNGDTIILSESIRLWQWSGASLSQVASSGPGSGVNKFGQTVPKTEIVSPQGFEISYCTQEAESAIKEVTRWKV